MSAIAAVQTAMFAVAVADTTLTAMLAPRIWDGGPGVVNDAAPGQKYPHVLMSGARELPMHTFGPATSGLGWTVRVPWWSRSRATGDDEALAIHARLVALFNFQPLTVTGFSQVSVEYAADTSGRVFVRDVDKLQTREVLAEFVVMVHQ